MNIKLPKEKVILWIIYCIILVIFGLLFLFEIPQRCNYNVFVKKYVKETIKEYEKK